MENVSAGQQYTKKKKTLKWLDCLTPMANDKTQILKWLTVLCVMLQWHSFYVSKLLNHFTQTR